jgi:site-specific recombinase XerD
VKEYNYDLVTFLKYVKFHFKLAYEENFDDININDITIETLKMIKLADLHSYLYFLKEVKKNKEAARARKTASIKAFFNYLTMKKNLLEINPAQNLETPELGKRLPKYLSLEESKKLLEVAKHEDSRYPERDFAIITLFLNCGVRLSELTGINIKHINFGEEKMNVIGKGNKERTIYLNKACMNAIQSYMHIRNTVEANYDSKDTLFLSERKKRISNRNVQYIVDNELKKAGLDTSKYSTHKLRHTAATLMYQYGKVDIRALQELLGHESISTTEIYTHVANDQIKSAVENNPLANL